MFVYGKNVAKETLRSNKAVKKAYLSKEFNDKEIISLLEKKNVNVEYLSKNEIMKMDKNNNQGIILSVPDFEYCSLSSIIDCEKPFIVILDHLEDPHNFGAIIRTCEAAGVTGIIIPKDRSVSVNATVVKVSTGAISDISIIQVTNLSQTIELLKKHGYWIVGTDMTGESYDKIDYKGNTVIIIGNEGKGMGTNIKNNCDFIATIPMNGKTNSLNASVAAGIIIFEAVKNRRS